MSRLVKSLFSLLIFLILLRRSPEFLKCEGLIVPNTGVNILVMCFAMLWKRCLYQRLCNIMAEGFRFMLSCLVRLRTSRLSAWVT